MKPNLLIVSALLVSQPGCNSSVAPGDQELLAGNDCIADGQLRVELYGEIQGRLDWQGAGLTCEGMPRPQDQGARLRFSGPAAGTAEAPRLAFIIALPDLQPGAAGNELEATVTLVQEGEGRFFSNRDNDICWSDVTGQRALAAANSYAIKGIVYCVAPLAELNGEGSVTLRDLQFSGLVSWRSAP